MANLFRLSQILGLDRPPAPHQQIKRESAHQDMILVELRRQNHVLPPSLVAHRLSIQPVAEHDA